MLGVLWDELRAKSIKKQWLCLVWCKIPQRSHDQKAPLQLLVWLRSMLRRCAIKKFNLQTAV